MEIAEQWKVVLDVSERGIAAQLRLEAERIGMFRIISFGADHVVQRQLCSVVTHLSFSTLLESWPSYFWSSEMLTPFLFFFF